MPFPDYYAIMNLEPNASAADIKAAYRRLARKYHPDVSSETDAEGQFKALGEAYEVLKDPERRARYDEARAQWQYAGRARSGDWQAFSGGGADIDPSRFEDLFSTLFRDLDHGNFSTAGDMEMQVDITLEEAYTGCNRVLRLAVPAFDASGQVHTRERRIEVAIPAGARDGERVRINARHVAGPLRVIVRHRPHALFRSDGRDVIHTLKVAPWEAALGASVPVPTLGGTVNLKLPPSTTTAGTLRLRGRGLPAPRGRPGDQLVEITMVTPRADGDALRNAYTQLADAAHEAGWQPRELVSA